MGGGGPLGVSTDDDGNQAKSTAACFGGMLRYHNTLVTDEEKSQSEEKSELEDSDSESSELRSEFDEGNEMINRVGTLGRAMLTLRRALLLYFR